jgi:hypothetical protein
LEECLHRSQFVLSTHCTSFGFCIITAAISRQKSRRITSCSNGNSCKNYNMSFTTALETQTKIPKVKQAPEGKITVSVTGGGGSGSAIDVASDKGGEGKGGCSEVLGTAIAGALMPRRGWLETIASCRRQRTSSAEASSRGV